MANAEPLTASSMEASSNTILAPLPPSSSCTRFRFPAEAWTILRPTAVDPVNAILSTPLCSARYWPGGMPVARHDIHYARRKTHIRHQPGDAQRAQRRELGRFQNDRIAGRQRRTHLPAREKQREIPRHDCAHHAQRLARNVVQKAGFHRHHGALYFVRNTAEIPEGRGCARHVEIFGIPNRMTRYRDSRFSASVLGIGIDRIGQAAAINARDPPPGVRFHAGNAFLAAATARSISTAVASAISARIVLS